MDTIPADFLNKWSAYVTHFSSVNVYSIGIGVFTLIMASLWSKLTPKIPGSLIAIIVTTAATQMLKLPVETIGGKFGAIPSTFQKPAFPSLHFSTFQELIRPAFTIALLGGIESLLSAVVADGMIRGNHRSNTELIAQGTANICSSIFGGIPATGAIARTATNIKNGARTPVAGIIHAVTLLIIMLFVGQWAAFIPMATLAGILVVVAYNMSELPHFLSLLKGGKSDAIVMMSTFLLTVLVDLTVAIEIGMILAAFLFMRNIMQSSSVQSLALNDEGDWGDYKLPPEIEIFEVHGPLFFGAAYKFKDAMKVVESPPRILIIRMRFVPIVDATGLRVLKEVNENMNKKGAKIILAEVNSEQVIAQLKQSRLLFRIGRANVTKSLDAAIKRGKEVLLESINQQPK